LSDSLSRFAALGAALAERGLGVQRPLTASSFDELAASVGKPPLRSLWSEARGALLVGSGGTAFFERFQQSSREGEHPLDAFTREEVEACCLAVLGPGSFFLKFPFTHEEAPLPFQNLARLAGAPKPGPLGLIVLAEWGPWWAFRALILLPFEVPVRPSLLDLCAACSAPCVDACPGDAVSRDGFRFLACAEHRKQDAGCADRCRARRACPTAAHHAYSPAQAAFHMLALTRLELASPLNGAPSSRS